ncbi:MAG: hypothetical protein ABDH21_00760 [bacterium]
MRVNTRKGAALAITLFILLIASIMISIIMHISKNNIKMFSQSAQESQYSQYVKEALDITVSPFVMGNGNLVTPNIILINPQADEFIWSFRNQFQTIQMPAQALNLSIAMDAQNTNNNFRNLHINISRRVSQNDNLWVVSNVHIEAIYLSQIPVLPIPEYQININTLIIRTNQQIQPIQNFAAFVQQTFANNPNRVVWQGRARARIIQRTPINLAQNAAVYVKYSGLWVPFGANPFSQGLLAQGVDNCIGITNGYTIIGDIATPRANPNERFQNAFGTQPTTAKSGFTTIWQGTTPSTLIRGGATTGYATIAPNLNTFNQNNNEYSIRTARLSVVNTNQNISNIQGRIPGESRIGNQVIDITSIPNSQSMVRITINTNQAVVVGQSIDSNGNLGSIRTRPQGGGLIEVLWPMDNNGNFVRINPNDQQDTNRTILNSYPPGYANVYVVLEGSNLKLYAVGKYSGQRVPVNELLQSMIVSQSVRSKFQVNTTNNEININLSNLTEQERTELSTLYVEGGNIVLAPSSSGNSTLHYGNNQTPFDLTIIAGRLGNTDTMANRGFYRDGNSNQPIDRRIGGWELPANQQSFAPTNFTLNLNQNSPNSVRYILPSQDANTYDRRRQVVRALEGNVIIQDFADTNNNGRRDPNERVGYIGFNMNSNNNADIASRKGGAKITIISHNFVILNYQSRLNRRDRAGLAADIITYRGSLQIIDEDSYRFLLDTGRFRNQEANNFLNLIITDSNLYWYGKYISNFANIEGVMLKNGTIRGFGNVTIEGSGTNHRLPRTTRSDFVIIIQGRPVVLYDILSFNLNR